MELFLVLLLLIQRATFIVQGVSNPEEYVHPLAGTFTDGNKFSTGNTLPLIGRPWGFNHWSPQTKEANRFSGSWWFQGSDHVLTWLRCTHQPSPWIGDWGYFVFTPILSATGQGVTRNPEHYWEPRGAVIKPYLFDATVAPYNIRIELTPTDHAAVLRVTFPKALVASPGERSERMEKRICFAESSWDSDGTISDGGGIGGRFIKGRSTQVHQDRMIISGFAMYILIESLEAVEVTRHDDMSCLRFKEDATSVTVRMATSFLSHEQAKVNLKREVKYSKSFERIAQESKAVWRNILKRVDVVDPGEQSEFASRNLAIFYTGLYRALMFPRRIDELSASNEVVHYSPYDPHVQRDSDPHPGILVTDNGFWDTYRTVYPLLSLAFPDHLAEIIQGWLYAYSEGGWLPSWASPGYRNCMVGTFADVVIADAIVKGVTGFNIMMAKDALLKDAFEEPPKFSDGAVGKLDLNLYTQKGFLPFGKRGGEVVSRTVDYGFADFSTSQALTQLASDPLYDHYFDADAKQDLLRKAGLLKSRSSSAFKSLFSRQTGLLMPRKEDGGLGDGLGLGFSAIEWGNGYTEGSPWHHSFPPYAIYSGDEHNLGELVALHGGKDKLLQKLRDLLNTPSDFKFGSYGQEIHEMVEMRAVAMGQYGHNNQPCHHLLYLFALLGDSEATQCLVRKVMEKAYGEDFYAGDEDNGEQGAWFVLSALGLYPVTPGTRGYVLGSPVFKHVRISRDERANKYENYYEMGSLDDTPPVVAEKGFDIVSLGAGPHVCKVERVVLNGVAVAGVTVSDSDLQKDGVLRFVMSGEQEGENRFYSRDNFLPEGEVERVKRSDLTSLEQTIDEQKIKLQQLTAEISLLKERAAKVTDISERNSSQLLIPIVKEKADHSIGEDVEECSFVYIAFVVLVAVLLCIGYRLGWLNFSLFARKIRRVKHELHTV